MIYIYLSIWCSILATLLVGAAVITDLRSRRIPNSLTLTAFAAAIILRTAVEGWPGLALGVAGAVLAPGLLLVLHAGKGLGMGDLKLIAAVGAFVGPAVGIAAVLGTAVAGGILAILIVDSKLALIASTFLIGLPFIGRQKPGTTAGTAPRKSIGTMPYGVAIAAGTVLTIVTCWCTGNEKWFF